MIEITNSEVVGWEHAIRGMRNPMNSWDKSDSCKCTVCEYNDDCDMCENNFSPINCVNGERDFCVGENDYELMKKLCKAGTDHRKFMRMIVVYCDITAPMYWWKEFDTYKVGTVRNSCSTMHKIHSKEFTLDDFSCEHLLGTVDEYSWDIDEPIGVLGLMIDTLNDWRKCFLQDKEKDEWWQLIQLLPSSYNQKSTVMLNYEALANMYHSRKSHKLDEWRDFCKWVESLPYSELITEN